MLRLEASYSNFSSLVTPPTQPRPSLTLQPQGGTLLWDDQCYLHESFYWDLLSLFDFVSPIDCELYEDHVQFSHSVMSSSLRTWYRSTPGLPVHHQLQEFTQTHVH